MKKEFVRILKLNLNEGTCKNIYPNIDKTINYMKYIEEFIESKMLYPDDYIMFRDFFNFEILKHRLSYNDILECVYRRKIGNTFYWVKAIAKKESDEIAQVTIKKIETVNDIYNEYFSLLAIASLKLIEANLTTNECFIDDVRQDKPLNLLLLEIIDVIDDNYKSIYIEFVNNLNKLIEKDKSLKFTYLINYKDIKKYNQIEILRKDSYCVNNKLVDIYISDIDENAINGAKKYENIVKMDAVFSNISRDYCAILLIDLNNNLCDSIKQTSEFDNKISIYTDLVEEYVDKLVNDKYKQLFKEAFMLENLKKIKNKNETIYIFKNKNERFFEVSFRPYNEDFNYIVALFKYKDDYVRNEINQRGLTLSIEKIYDLVIALDANTFELIPIKLDKFINSSNITYIRNNLNDIILDNYIKNYNNLILSVKNGKSCNTEIGFYIDNQVYYYEVFLMCNKILEENNYLILAKNVTGRVNNIMKNNVLSASVSKAFEAILTINLNTLKIELLGHNKSFFDINKINDYNNLYNIGMKLITNTDSEILNYFNVETLKKVLKENLTVDTFLDVKYNGMDIRINVVTFAVPGVNDSVIMLFRNVSNTYKMELESKRLITDALQRAENASEAKSLFLSKVSHDIRTPLNAIIGMTYLLKKDKIDEELRKSYISKIEVSSNHLLGIINEILDMNVIESGSLSISEDTVNLKEFFNDIVAMFSPEISQKGLNFDISMNISNEVVIADNVKLRKIVSNLLSNAMKYTNSGFVKFQINEKKSNKKSARYEFIIEDSGVGIDDDFMDKIFIPFERGYDTRINKIQGTGLGMPIVKNLVEMLEGSIEIKSKVNKGTKAIVNLEFILKHGSILDANPFGYNESFVGRKVLLVEDNEINQEILKTILESFDIEVVIASDGLKGYEEYLNNNYDLILCDIQMPLLDGYELTKRIRESNKEDAKTVKIIAVTANAFSTHVEKSYHVGMNDHLSKPIIVNDLLRILNKYL